MVTQTLHGPAISSAGRTSKTKSALGFNGNGNPSKGLNAAATGAGHEPVPHAYLDHTSNVCRADIVRRAEKAIEEYTDTMAGAYDDALPLLNRALAATYAAACALQKDPERLAAFLDERRSGPVSGNAMQPIVRKLWKGVQTRDKLHRHSACLALAQAEGVKPADFAEWLSEYPGGTKKAAAKYSRSHRLPDARTKLLREKKARTSQLLAKFEPITLSDEIGARQPGLHLAAIRVSPEGKAELDTVFDDLPPAQVDAFITRVLG
jgi:hypothetical protein